MFIGIISNPERKKTVYLILANLEKNIKDKNKNFSV